MTFKEKYKVGFAAGMLCLATNTYGASIFTNFYSFSTFATNSVGISTNASGANCQASLALSCNTLYGTTTSGGTNGTGTLFRLNADGSGFSSLYQFADKGAPTASLLPTANLLYGTASLGGTNGTGSVFKIAKNGSGFTNLYQFPGLLDLDLYGKYTNSAGAHPEGALVEIGSSLYGTATDGGQFGSGCIFRMNVDGTGFTNLHSFTTLSGMLTNADGAHPTSGMVTDGERLYGSTEFGGIGGAGTVFALKPDGSGFTNLYSFTPPINFTNGDGAYIFSGLALSGGRLFGSTLGGGLYGNGTLFAVAANGSGFTNLHTFTGMVGLTNLDGAKPVAPLSVTGNTLYGTTQLGGRRGNGIIFSVETNGGNFQNLFNFAQVNANPSGIYTNSAGSLPQAGVTFCGGTFFGTTPKGGAHGNGGIYALSLGPIPLDIEFCDGQHVLTWGNPAFTLLAATNLATSFVPVPGAASPYTNNTTDPQKLFELQAF